MATVAFKFCLSLVFLERSYARQTTHAIIIHVHFSVLFFGSVKPNKSCCSWWWCRFFCLNTHQATTATSEDLTRRRQKLKMAEWRPNQFITNKKKLISRKLVFFSFLPSVLPSLVFISPFLSFIICRYLPLFFVKQIHVRERSSFFWMISVFVFCFIRPLKGAIWLKRASLIRSE